MAGGGLDGLQSGEEGLLAETGAEGSQVGLMGRVGDGHGDLVGTGGLDRERDIFLRQAEGEGRVVEALAEQVWGEAHVGSGGAEAELLDEVLWVESGLGAEDEGFLHDLVAAEDDDVVEQFEQTTGAGFSEVEDVGADVLEQRADSLEGVCIAAAEDGERAGFGAGTPPVTGASM